MFKVTIKFRDRIAKVYEESEPRQLAHFTGSLEQCNAIALLLNERMAKMDKLDRKIPVKLTELETAAEAYIDSLGVCYHPE